MPIQTGRLKTFKAKDPTRTVMLRRAMLTDMAQRFAIIRKAVYNLVAIEDAFGLRPNGFTVNEGVTFTVNDRWRFLSDKAKVAAFQAHLKELVDTELLSSATPETPWTDPYIASAYKQGLKRGYFDGKASLSRPSKLTEGTVESFLDNSFGSPESIKKLELLGTRTFTNLKGVSAAMDQQLSNALVQGLAEGKAPGAIAKEMSDAIDGLSRGRAATIARTEIIHAHAEGQLDSFDLAGVQDVIVQAEWATAEDDKVCSKCAPLQGVIFTVKEARGLIPRHPNCRCAWLPAGVGEELTGQAWSDRQAKIIESVKAETGLTDGKAAKAASRWLGAETKIKESITNLKPKKSALKEAQAAAKENATKAAKLKKAQDLAAKAAADKAKLTIEVNLKRAKAKLDQAGLPTALTEFEAGGVSDALATKILTTEQGLLVAPEELIPIVTEAKAQEGAAKQVAVLLDKRQQILDDLKAAARAQQAAEAAKTAAETAKAATKALTGLGDAMFVAEGKLTTEGLTTLVETLDLTPAQVRLLTKATTAADEAAVLAEIVPKAKAATAEALDAAALKYGTPKGLFTTGEDVDDWLDLKWAVQGHSFKTPAESQAFLSWSADTIGAIDNVPNPAAKLKKLEALIEDYKAAAQAQAAAKRALELDTIDAAIFDAGGALPYKDVKKIIKHNLTPSGEVATIDWDQAVTSNDILETIIRTQGGAKALPLVELDPALVKFAKGSVPLNDVTDALKNAKWKNAVLVTKYKGELYVTGNEASVLAAKYAKVPKLHNVYQVDLDKWFADAKAAKKTAKAAKWATTGAQIDVDEIPNVFDSWLKGFGPDQILNPVKLTATEQAAYVQAVADAKSANLLSDVIALEPGKLAKFSGATPKADIDAAFDYAINADSYQAPWPGVKAYKYKGQTIINQNVAVAEAAELAGVKKIMVEVIDLDAFIGVQAVPTPTPVPTAATSLIDMIGGKPKFGTMPTASQVKAIFSEVNIWHKYDGDAHVASASDVFKVLGYTDKFQATSATKQKILTKKLELGKYTWQQQFIMAEQFSQTGVAVSYEFVGYVNELAKKVNITKLVGASNKLTAPGLKQLQKAYGLVEDDAWVAATAKAKNIEDQILAIKDRASHIFDKADNNLGLAVPADVNSTKKWATAHQEYHKDLYTKWGYAPGDKPTYAEFHAKVKEYTNTLTPGLYQSYSDEIPFSVSLENLENWIQANPDKLKKVPLGGTPGVVQKVSVPKAVTGSPAVEAALPDFNKIKVLQDLAGSTKPQLIEDTTNGSKWVMKAGLDPGHVKSEALADDLYRRLGFAVPRSGIVETSGGPVKFSEFLPDGKTLQDYLRTATPDERAAALVQVKKGFVADALFANHDVAGLSMDNLFVSGGKVYRIDNGGALLYRAQGAAKRDFGAVVKELASMRDRGVNTVTAELFSGITDEEIHEQIRAIVNRREQLLAGVPDAALRKTIGERIDWLKSQLPPDTTPVELRRHISATPTPAVYEVTPETIKRTKAARVNGVNFAADKDMIEDQNLLIWEETGSDGKPVMRAAFKVTPKGSKALTDAMPTTKLGIVQQSPDKHPDDDFYTAFVGAAKTVSVHAKDKNYNAATMANYTVKKQQLKALQAATPATDGAKHAMIQHYLDMQADIEEAVNKNDVVNKTWAQYVVPKQTTTAKRPRDAFNVTTAPTGDRLNEIVNGRARVKGDQSFELRRGPSEGFHVEADNNVKLHFVPSVGTNGGNAFGGRVVVTVPGGVTPETVQALKETMGALGVDMTASTPAAEEALYIHKTIYLRKLHNQPSYQNIWADTTLDDATRVTRLKAWVRTNMGVDLPDNPTPEYNPAGRALSGYGDGFRVWDRWDVPPKQMAEDLKDYYLAHYTQDLYESPRGAVGELVPKLLNTGGELTSTMARVRKGIHVRGTGGDSSTEDMATGGADYAFTRLYKRNNKIRGQHGLFFKPEAAARVDAIHYDDDKFGRTTDIHTRMTDVASMKAASDSRGNELIFKNGLSLIYDIDTIAVWDKAERQIVIDAYTAAGLSVLPDGRAIADVVIVR